MDQSSGQAPEGAGGPDADVVVDVTRTGGFAGMTRAWTAAPAPAETSDWVQLIARCPWEDGADAEDAEGADRFLWRIRARCGPDEDRRAEVPDGALVGAWRELVDAVRAWATDLGEEADGGSRESGGPGSSGGPGGSGGRGPTAPAPPRPV